MLARYGMGVLNEKVQLESARIVTGLPKFASRDSLYYETG